MPLSLIRTADQARGKVGGVKWLPELITLFPSAFLLLTFLENAVSSDTRNVNDRGGSAPTAPFGKSATANQSSTTLDAHAGIQGNDVDVVFP